MYHSLKKSILFCLFLLLIACDKQTFEEQNSRVPAVGRFSVTVPKNNIQSPGTFTVVNGQGYQGIIVFNIDNVNYRAFDLGCPYTDPNICKNPMSVNLRTGEMSCKACATDDIVFTQYKTSVTFNNNTYYLRAYNTYNEENSVIISNF